MEKSYAYKNLHTIEIVHKAIYRSPTKEIFDRAIASSTKKLNSAYDSPEIKNLQTLRPCSSPPKRNKQSTKQYNQSNNKKAKTNTEIVINSHMKTKNITERQNLTQIENSDKNNILGKTNLNNLDNKDSLLISKIKEIIKTTHSAPKRSIFKFENNISSAQHNDKIIKSCNFDFEKAFGTQKGTNIYYGSEFRPTKLLNILLKYHRDWKRLESTLLNGTDTTIKELSNEDLLKESEKFLSAALFHYKINFV